MQLRRPFGIGPRLIALKEIAPMIQTKRVYDRPSRTDGLRVLVDRIWPRGLTKTRAAVELWAKDLAPSTELRQWFDHDPKKWEHFQSRYRRELRDRVALLQLLKRESKRRTVTLLFGARDEEHNQAVVLKGILETMDHDSASSAL
jgi:uncharacterized protein YeaO (DUF488 family)